MTQAPVAPMLVRKLVVIFDICSSTAILEDLIRTENHLRWEQLFGKLKRFCWKRNFKRQMYKFLGDGWILLFDVGEVSGDELLSFLTDLSAEYERLFNKEIRDVLANMPAHLGMTFGVDEGSLVAFQMNGKREYFGRALNVASRLQAAIKSFDGSPCGTLLISNNAFSRLKVNVTNDEVQCNLPNVAGGDRYRVRKLRIPTIEGKA